MSAGRGQAAVHCIIVGFAVQGMQHAVKHIFRLQDDDVQRQEVNNISPYLVEGNSLIVQKRSKPLCNVARMINGNKPTDGGHLLLSEAEYLELITKEPLATQWIKPFSMGEEFINNIPRYCLWLPDCPPEVLKKMPLVLQRVQAVQKMRAASTKKATQEDANKPTLFAEIRQPTSAYIALPRVSSERRVYIPIGFLPAEHIAGDKLQMIPNASRYEFGVMCSIMHNAWMRVVSGRLESRYQYSALITYNSFPWPLDPTDKQKATVETAAQAVLDARAAYPDSSLADLYDPLLMPANLLKAHQQLDKAVDAAYGTTKFKNEAERVAYLFGLYEQYIAAEKAVGGIK